MNNRKTSPLSRPFRRGQPIAADMLEAARQAAIEVFDAGAGIELSRFGNKLTIRATMRQITPRVGGGTPSILVFLSAGPDGDNLYTATPAEFIDFNVGQAKEGAVDIKVGFPNVSGTLPSADDSGPALGVFKRVWPEGVNESGDAIYHCYDVSIPRRQYGTTPGDVC